jgi:sugar phosphate isomerase/epimerase
MNRRTLLASFAVAAVASAKETRAPEWKPKVGILGPFTEGNVEFAHKEGFGNMILGSGPHSTLDAAAMTDEQIQHVKSTIEKAGISVSALQITVNHIDPDPAKRERANAYFINAIELAGKLGVPYIGTASGKDPSKSLDEQVQEIVRLYTDKYFTSCEKHHVRLLWEPYPGGPNVATSPVGFEALFKGFGNSQYVGLQYDPSHLVWQMMDPIQTARDFVDKIYDVHLKDTEIRWDVLRKGGINPVNKAEWWSYRLPGLGSIDWPAFFTVLQRVGYQGAMSIEHEDPLYGSPNRGGLDFSPQYGMGFRMAKRYLKQYVPSA